MNLELALTVARPMPPLYSPCGVHRLWYQHPASSGTLRASPSRTGPSKDTDAHVKLALLIPVQIH